MKTNDLILISSTVAFSFLFYNETYGINYLIFNALILILMFVKKPELFKTSTFLLAVFGCLISSIALSVYGNLLSFIANLFALSLLSALAFSPKSSVFLGLLFSFFSYISALFRMPEAWKKRKLEAPEGKKSISFKKLFWLIGIPFLVVLVFFFLYRSSSVLFQAYTSEIDLMQYLSFPWLIFTFFGFVLLFGFWNHYKIIHDDETAANNLQESNYLARSTFGFTDIITENLSGIVLFALLNFILLIVNALDLDYLYISKTLPEGVTYLDFLHQGIDTLIFSIVVAIVLILLYFQKDLNFFPKNKALKVLVLIWIVQNILMVFNYGSINERYISEYGLTYKRIGVFVYLFLTLIGLVLTALKVYQAKSNWFLVRKMGWIFYLSLVFSCTFNWDLWITNYNIKAFSKKERFLDLDYLLKLGDGNIARLFEYQKEMENRIYFDNSQIDFKAKIERKAQCFLYQQKDYSWKSWSYQKAKIAEELRKHKELEIVK